MIYKRAIMQNQTKNLIKYEIRMMFYWIIIFVGFLCSIIPLGIQPATRLTRSSDQYGIWYLYKCKQLVSNR